MNRHERRKQKVVSWVYELTFSKDNRLKISFREQKTLEEVKKYASNKLNGMECESVKLVKEGR